MAAVDSILPTESQWQSLEARIQRQGNQRLIAIHQSQFSQQLSI